MEYYIYHKENLNKILKILLLFLSFTIKKGAPSQEESLVEVTYVLFREKITLCGIPVRITMMPISLSSQIGAKIIYRDIRIPIHGRVC